MYLLTAKIQLLKDLGFTEGYTLRHVEESLIEATVVITPAFYMMLLLKYTEDTDLKTNNDNHKYIRIFGDYYYYLTNSVYELAILKMATLSPIKF